MKPEPGRIESTKDVWRFLLAGWAVFTLVSTATGKRFTYQIWRGRDDPRKAPVWFVDLLVGADNSKDYVYLGLIESGGILRATAKSARSDGDPAMVALRWVLRRLVAGLDLSGVEIWHAGKCGRCGKRLTVPGSLRVGLGPECQEMGE